MVKETGRNELPERGCDCGYKGNDYKIEEATFSNGTKHIKGICPQCNRYFLKYIPKENKYGTRQQKALVFPKTDGRCGYCGTIINSHIKNALHLDHMTPPEKGGTNDNDNLIFACTHCNCQKNNKTVEEYRTWIKKKQSKKYHAFYFEVRESGWLKDIFKNMFDL